MKDFWLSCGHHLTDRDAGGGLLVTDEFLKVYLARPELIPPPEACAAERGLHAALLADPRRRVGAEAIAAVADADARENWTLMIAFRDHLLRHKTLEAAYLDLVRRGVGDTPPLFLNQLVHVILRNALDGCDDPFVLRAAELFFRPQRMAIHDGALIAADEEKIAGTGAAPLSPLVSMLGLPAGAEIDVLTDDNAASYWERSDLFDMALDLTVGRRGLAALGTALERWVRHLLSLDVRVEPLRELRDVPLTWYVGLDAEGTRIGDALWQGEEVDESERRRLAGLFQLTFGSVQPAGRRRCGLSHPGDDCRQDAAPEAAESADRVAGPARGGRDMSPVAPLLRIPVGVVVERRKANSPWVDFVWRPVAVLGGLPDAAPWTKLGDRRKKQRPSMPARPRSSSIARRPTITAGILPRESLPSGWRCRRPAAIRPTRSPPSPRIRRKAKA